MAQLSNAVKPIRLSNKSAAGQTLITSSALNMANAEGVLLLVAFGTITAGAVTSVKIQQSSDNGVADDFSDVAGSGVSVPDNASNKMIGIDTSKCTKPYLKVLVTRGTQNAEVDGIFALQYGQRVMPPVKDATYISQLQITGAPEGTP